MSIYSTKLPASNSVSPDPAHIYQMWPGSGLTATLCCCLRILY